MDEQPENEFVTPQVVEPEPEPQAEAQKMVLASQVLPDRLYLLPTEAKPIFPGLLFPVVQAPGAEADVLRLIVEQVPERVVGFVLPKEQTETEGGESLQRQLYRIGTVARVLKMQTSPEGAVQVLLQGLKRFQILKAVQRDNKLMAQVVYLEDVRVEGDDVKALCLAIMNTMRDLIKHNPLFSEEIRMFLTRADWSDAGRLADFAVTMTSSTREELQDVLECLDVKARLEKALFLLRKELDINELKEKITHQIEEKITKQQREFFLREQMKAIKQELGLEKDEKTEELEKYQARLKELVLPDEAKARIEEELDKLKLLPTQSPEFGVSRNYLDWLTGLPWGKYSEDQLDVPAARKVLDRDHYGLDDVKARILDGGLTLAGSRQRVAVLFSDLRGFSTFSEGRDPEAIVSHLNTYFDGMVEAIQRHGGVVDKFIGDAVMATFGGVSEVDRPCDAAVEAALAMRESLAALNARWAAAGAPTFESGVGIEYGEVLEGPIGSAHRKEFTVIGDAVNVAARVESQADAEQILISEELYKQVRTDDDILLRFFGEVTVKGGDIKAGYEKGKLVLKSAGIESSMGVFSLSGLADLEAEGHVLPDGHVGPEGIGLEDEPDPPLPRGDKKAPPSGEDRLSSDPDLPGVGNLETGDHPEDRRLPTPRRPQEREEFPRIDREAQVVDGGDAPEPFGKPFDFDHGHFKSSPFSRRCVWPETRRPRRGPRSKG